MTKVFVNGPAKPASITQFVYLCLVAIWISCCAAARGQTAATLGWTAPPDASVTGFYLYYGNASQMLSTKVDVGTNTMFTITGLTLGTNYFFAVSSYGADGLESALSTEVQLTVPFTMFFNGNASLGSGVEYLEFPDQVVFGYYDQTGYPWVYHFDMGFEYVINAGDQQGSVYLYDNSSQSFWFTSPALFPYLYDFKLNSWIYYYADTTKPGRYTSNPRYFYDFNLAQVITK
ncbi:MAG: Fibronectin, type domain protein [Pedosphaera sp.]|nr:Fibronectin, type domain protein [Pedosphaera sp.]